MFERKEKTTTPEEQVSEQDLGAEDRQAALEAELASANDLLLRRTADLENMRRRHQQERMQLILDANKRLITELLPTIDDLERTLSFVKPEEQSPITEGVELVYKNFLKVLEQHNVKPIESVGKPFDVHLHDALMEEVRTDVEPGTITTEVQKGYHMHDAVLRHAKVIVAKGAEE
ncbi:MAG: nucleotide exchange factor GrpE [Bacteroidetes bacterium]|nr:nucleotide exchange factor GrpE [Bacteroidota bacterium]